MVHMNGVTVLSVKYKIFVEGWSGGALSNSWTGNPEKWGKFVKHLTH